MFVEIQTVPVASGNVIVLAAVPLNASVVGKFAVPYAFIFPLLSIVNLVAPLFDAVKRSPEPSLLAIRDAKDVVPEMEATPSVPDPPLTSNVKSGAVVPIPTLAEPVAEFTPFMLPNIKLSLCDTYELAPMAVALMR